jgi:aspartyl-tRNA(Asn)/glutamyl-tRNA(Gln) amidotransferase subunit B
VTLVPVIGLEIHTQLATRAKIFSGASTRFGAAPNSQACAVDLGLPGVLPVLNEAAVRMAVTFGLAIDAEIGRHSTFDRKNYFYPDLPKGYQISQFEAPIVGRGHLELSLPDGTTRRIGITRAHLEEDAGKSLHEAFPGATGIDLNRAGMPLLEIVSEPELTSAAEAAAYFRQMHALVRYLGICDGNLNEGSMRCDANVSVHRAGEPLGVRVEIKNLNSFRFLERAIEFEIARQCEVIERGGTVARETRLFDPERNETRTMRSKELSDDYRYFPEPDLLPVELAPEYVEAIRAALPELPQAKCARYQREFALGAYDALRLTADPDLAAYFEETVAAGGTPKLAANWVLGAVSAALNRYELTAGASAVHATQLGRLVARIADGTLSSKTATALFEALWAEPGADVDATIAAHGLAQSSDTGELERLVDEVVTANPGQVAQFRAGKEKVLGFFVGQVMKATQGKANPQRLNELLRARLARD